MPIPIAFILSVVLLIGSAYVLVFPRQLAEAQLRRQYGENWANYVDVTRARLITIVLGALFIFGLSLLGIIVAGTELFGPGD